MIVDSFEAVGNLMDLGFTVRQAEFLYLVGTQTGVFTMEQYRVYAGIKMGKACVSLVNRLNSLKFVGRYALSEKSFIMHIDNKRFYRTILTPDSRLRRSMSWGLMRQRLQFMDYIARNPEKRYLPTEESKRETVMDQLGVPEAVLPVKVFTSPDGNSSTARFFPVRFPMFIRGAGEGVTLGVVYGEDPAFTFQAFRKFVFTHRAFFDQIPCLNFVYVSPFEGRRNLAINFLTALFERSHAVINEEMMRYFVLRKKIDENRQREFSDDDYAFWTFAYARFKGPEYEPLYASFYGNISEKSLSCARPRRTFECTTFASTTTLKDCIGR
jgi:hypothetical protein